MSINFGADFSSATTLGPVASALLAQLREGPQTVEQLREVSGRGDISRQLKNLVERGLVHETVRANSTTFVLSTKSARHIAASLRDVSTTARMGIVVTGVPERNKKFSKRTETFG